MLVASLVPSFHVIQQKRVSFLHASLQLPSSMKKPSHSLTFLFMSDNGRAVDNGS